MGPVVLTSMNALMPMAVAMTFVSILKDPFHARAVQDSCCYWTDSSVETLMNVLKLMDKCLILAAEGNASTRPEDTLAYVPEA